MKVYHTEQRKSILDYLESRQDACVTAGEVAAALSAAVSKSAVYRNLADLEKEGKVVRVSTHGGRSAGTAMRQATLARGGYIFPALSAAKPSTFLRRRRFAWNARLLWKRASP